MKRTATTLALLAGLGGGCLSPDGASRSKKDLPPTVGSFNKVTKPAEVPGLVGPNGQPVTYGARGAAPADYRTPTAAGYATVGGAVAPAPADAPTAPAVQPAGSATSAEGCTDGCPPRAPKLGAKLHAGSHMGLGVRDQYYDPSRSQGILPVPGMGPPGAVAAVGAIPAGAMQAPINQRSSVKFIGPSGTRITWQLPTGTFGEEANALTAPATYNFTQGGVYRLRLSSILPSYPGKVFYPTLEVVPGNPKTVKFLAHSTIPIGFTNEDFDQALAGNMVVKVVYLPDREFADFATVAGGGAEEVVSTRLDPGSDPIAEAQRRGSILAIVTLGNIDLENRYSPAMNQPSPYLAPPGGMMPQGGLPPGAMPAGAMPAGAMPPGTMPMGAVSQGQLPQAAVDPKASAAPVAPLETAVVPISQPVPVAQPAPVPVAQPAAAPRPLVPPRPVPQRTFLRPFAPDNSTPRPTLLP